MFLTACIAYSDHSHDNNLPAAVLTLLEWHGNSCLSHQKKEIKKGCKRSRRMQSKRAAADLERTRSDGFSKNAGWERGGE